MTGNHEIEVFLASVVFGLAAMNIFCMSSRNDGFHNDLGEAMGFLAWRLMLAIQRF